MFTSMEHNHNQFHTGIISLKPLVLNKHKTAVLNQSFNCNDVLRQGGNKGRTSARKPPAAKQLLERKLISHSWKQLALIDCKQ